MRRNNPYLGGTFRPVSAVNKLSKIKKYKLIK